MAGAEETDSGEEVYQKWVGKDFYNPFIRDFVELNEPSNGTYQSSIQIGISVSCMTIILQHDTHNNNYYVIMLYEHGMKYIDLPVERL